MLRGTGSKYRVRSSSLRTLSLDRLLAKLNFPLEPFDASFQILDGRILQLHLERNWLFDWRREGIVIEHGPDLQAPVYPKTAARLSAGEAEERRCAK